MCVSELSLIICVLLTAHSSEATIEKIQLELQTGNKAASKIIRVVAMQSLAEADEMKGNILKKLNKLLTVDGETQVRGHCKEFSCTQTLVLLLFHYPNLR